MLTLQEKEKPHIRLKEKNEVAGIPTLIHLLGIALNERQYCWVTAPHLLSGAVDADTTASHVL